jgi:hypothetical protein
MNITPLPPPVTGHRGILAPLPGLDPHPLKTQCVSPFSKSLVSQLTWTHNYPPNVQHALRRVEDG